MQHMNDDEILKLITKALGADRETDLVEFKDSRGGFPDDLSKTISSFSNKSSGGGIIVMGVEEDKKKRTFNLVGLTNSHELVERSTTYFSDRIVNADRPQYRHLSIEDKDILVIIINATQEEKKPCFDSKKGMDRGSYIRDGNTDRPITDDELRHFIRNSSAFKHDLEIASNITLDELDATKIEKVLTEMGQRTGRESIGNAFDETTLQNIKIASIKDGLISPTLAGSLVFARQECFVRSPFSRFAIRCVHYAGPTPTSPIIDKLDIAGPLDYQIDTMRSFVLRNIPIRAKIEGSLRVESPVYPEEALREILANAVIHRDYTITETYTQIRIFSDRIEVINPGNLAPGVTVDNIKDMQFSRNSVIASLMRDLNYLEEYGRGIDLAFGSMQKAGLPRPIFRNTANIFSVTLLGETFKGLTERQLSIWQVVLNRSRTTAKYISEHLSISRPTTVGDLNRLIELGLVHQVGSGPHITYQVDSGL